MARFKEVNRNPRFPPIVLETQLQPFVNLRANKRLDRFTLRGAES